MIAKTVSTAPRRATGKWELVALLWVAFFLNQADRQIFNVTLPLLQQDLGLSDVQVGSVATIFTIAFGVLVPVAGLAGDRYSRSWIVIASLLVFSFGTVMTGAVSSYWFLLLFRSIATGAGEAFYFPAATALIGDAHARSSGRAIALHQTANYTGVIAGSFVAGWIADVWGWREAFVTFGVAGLIWASVLAVRLRGPVAKGSQPAANGAALMREAMLVVRTSPLVRVHLFGFAGMAFIMVGYLTWMPTIYNQRFGGTLAESGAASVLYNHLAAYIAVLFGGWLGDKLASGRPAARLVIMGIAMSSAAPFILLTALSPGKAAILAGLAGFGLCRGFFDANQFAALYDATEARLRSSITGIVVAAGFLVGSLSPLLMGVLGATWGLQVSMILLAAAAATAGPFLLWTAWQASRAP